MCEYPIIDGLPILVSDLRTYIAENISPIFIRNDLSGEIESLLGDCCGEGSSFDTHRRHLSTYAESHYGDMDTVDSEYADVVEGSVVQALKQGIAKAGDAICGPVIDMGCSVGRTSFEIAEISNDLVLGIDLNFSMMKLAAGILRKNEVIYPKRRVGMVYERRSFPVSFAQKKQVDFWVCDATCLPFAADSFAFGLSMNVLDCVRSPYDHLKELASVLRPAARVIVTTPYDWNTHATPVESWIGGHSQRSENKGSSEAQILSLLSDGGHPQAIQALECLSEIKDIPWRLRLHNRSIMAYMIHMLILRKKP